MKNTAKRNHQHIPDEGALSESYSVTTKSRSAKPKYKTNRSEIFSYVDSGNVDSDRSFTISESNVFTKSGTNDGTENLKTSGPSVTLSQHSASQHEEPGELSMPGLTFLGRPEKPKKTKVEHIAVAINSLEKDCLYLKKFAYMKKIDLPEEPMEVFTKVNRLFMKAAGTDRYEECLNIVRDVFSDIKPSGKGTVGDFFIACRDSNGCTIECAGNLPNAGYTKNSFCVSHVGVYQSGELEIRYSPGTATDVILIHTDENKISLPKRTINELKSVGIRKARISRKVGDKFKTDDSKDVDIDSLTCEKDKYTEEGRSYSNTGLILLFFIILIFVIIAIIYCCFYGDKSTTHGYENVRRVSTTTFW